MKWTGWVWVIGFWVFFFGMIWFFNPRKPAPREWTPKEVAAYEETEKLTDACVEEVVDKVEKVLGRFMVGLDENFYLRLHRSDIKKAIVGDPYWEEVQTPGPLGWIEIQCRTEMRMGKEGDG